MPRPPSQDTGTALQRTYRDWFLLVQGEAAWGQDRLVAFFLWVTDYLPSRSLPACPDLGCFLIFLGLHWQCFLLYSNQVMQPFFGVVASRITQNIHVPIQFPSKVVFFNTIPKRCCACKPMGYDVLRLNKPKKTIRIGTSGLSLF